MDLADLARLRSAEGQAALQAAADLQPTEEGFLAHLTRLSRQVDAPLARAALETVLLRERARAKFTRAQAMYFTREALEQASGEVISRYRAGRFAGRARIADLACGLGGDAIGLGAAAAVTLVDRDPLRLALAEVNLAAYGLAPTAMLCADLTAAPPPEADGLWFDPARRSGGRRRFALRDYEPPLSVVLGWLARAAAVGVKLSPGVDLAELAAVLGGGAPPPEIEFISVRGELKECALWFGPLRTAPRRATLLPGPHTLTEEAPAPPRPALAAPARYLYEPDPAILRAGLVATLAARLGAAQLDPDIAYLTSEALTATPFARAFEIDDAFPFQLKRLRAYLRDRRVGAVTVKKRGSPLEPQALARQLRLEGPESRIVFLTHVAGAAHVLIGRAAG